MVGDIEASGEQQRTTMQRDKIFFGWYTVLATAIISAWSWGSWGYGFGAYYKPLQDEFNWTRAEISAAYSLNKLEGGLEGPWGGVITDKYGPRIVAICGLVLAGTGLCLMYFMDSLLQYILIWGLIVSLGFNLGTLDPLEKALSDWFVRKRGKAIGLGRVGLALGGAFGPPLMTYLLFTFGWRTAFLIAGLLTWIICIPLAWFFVKPRRPEYYGLMPDGAKIQSPNVTSKDTNEMIEAGEEYARSIGEIELTLRQTMKTRAFWILVVYNILYSFFWASIAIHQIPHLTDIGVDPMAAATVLGFMVLMSAPGRVVGGWLSDKLAISNMKYILVAAYSLQAIGMVVLINANSLEWVYVFTVLCGFGGGVAWTSRALLRARFFGRKAFATVFGTITLISLPATIVSPIYVGWVYDVTNSYVNAFTQSLVLLIITIILFLFLKPPQRTRATKVSEFL
jgi:MFS family permease